VFQLELLRGDMEMWRAVIIACVLGRVTFPPTQHSEWTSQCTEIFSKNKELKFLHLLGLEVPISQRELQNKFALLLVMHDVNGLETDILPFLHCSIFCFANNTELHLCTLQPSAYAASSLADFYTLKMEAIFSSETSVHTRSTRRHIPEDGILYSHRCENLRSYNI
jgi:hypothetical protein